MTLQRSCFLSIGVTLIAAAIVAMPAAAAKPKLPKMLKLSVHSSFAGNEPITVRWKTDRAMPKGQAWMFARNMRPIRLQMLSYAQVSPWRDWVGESPITGTRLHAPAKIAIDYPQLQEKKR